MKPIMKRRSSQMPQRRRRALSKLSSSALPAKPKKNER